MKFAYRNNQGVSDLFVIRKKHAGFVFSFWQLGRWDFLLGSTSGKLTKPIDHHHIFVGEKDH